MGNRLASVSFASRPGFDYVLPLPRAAEVARTERLQQALLIYKGSARGVDQEGTGLHEGEGTGVEQVPVRFVEPGVDADDIAAGQEFVELRDGVLRDTFQGVAEIGPRIDLQPLAGGHEL